MRMWSCIPIPLDTTFSLTFSNYPIQKLMLYLTISSACPTTGHWLKLKHTPLPEFDDGCLEWENIDWDADKVGCDYNGSSSGSGSGSDSGSGSGSDACSDAINMICSCNTTGSYEHVLGGGVTLTLVDEVALFVFISWSCANIIDGVYNPTVTINLKGVETINGMSYVEGSFNGSGTLSNNKVYYTITYQCEIGGVIHNRIIQRNIDV